MIITIILFCHRLKINQINHKKTTFKIQGDLTKQENLKEEREQLNRKKEQKVQNSREGKRATK